MWKYKIYFKFEKIRCELYNKNKLDNDIGSDGVEYIYNILKYLPKLSSLNVNCIIMHI